jgi:GT2 family glycosyltransferase
LIVAIPTVSVVIPTWNRADLIRNVLLSLRRQTTVPTEILVVDNGSSDDTAQVVRDSPACLIALEKNVGFAAAVNEGVRNAASEWVFILNNDVELQADWISCALAAAERSDVDFVTGKLVQAHAPERIDGTCDLVSRAGTAWRCGWNSLDGTRWSQARRVRVASLTAVMFRRRVFQKVGLLDTEYESYYEDVDFGIRCAMKGVEGFYEPRAKGIHLGSATLRGGGRVSYLVARNQLLLAKKFRLAEMNRWNVIVGQSVALLPTIRQRHFIAALRGKWDGWRLAKTVSPAPFDPVELDAFLKHQEKELYEEQSKSGFDLSWRLYFWLCGR